MAGGRSCWCLETFAAGALTAKNVDVIECSRLRPALQSRHAEQAAGLRAHASIPLYFDGRPLGIMNVTGADWRRLGPAELELLSTIGYQVALAVERARLAETSARLARSEERARLAREIHDTLAQGLTAIALHLESALRRLDSDPAGARARLDQALATTQDSLEEARRSVLDLRSAPLAGRPLDAALAALARGVTAETGVRVHLRLSALPPLPLRTEAELYRIAQEALTNVRRHAGAHTVELGLQAIGARIRLSIRDDGQGFTPRAVPADRYGLLGMRERARLLGGHLRVSTRPGTGTRLTVTVPIDAAATASGDATPRDPLGAGTATTGRAHESPTARDAPVDTAIARAGGAPNSAAAADAP
jgi:two-component system NarL family sensor kinase